MLSGSDSRYLGYIASEFAGQNYTQWNTDRMAVFNFGVAEVRVLVVISEEWWQLNVVWSAPNTERLTDCFQLGSLQWYGGPEQWLQSWPVQKLSFTESHYTVREDGSSAVSEPYWINSEGTILYVDKEVPLFIDQNNYLDNHLCFISQVKNPYSDKRTHSNLIYDVVFTKNARVGHQYAVGKYLGKPVAYPDFRMIQHPIWSTWARYFKDINQNVVMEYARSILSNGFNNSQLEIDDLWETCYGSLTIDVVKFPDFKQMVEDLKGMGFRVAIWIHPFINEGCDPWFSEAKEKGYLVTAEDGSVNGHWWNMNGTNSAHVDFTNPEAASWWLKRLADLKNTYNIDSYKFDAGEMSFSPQIAIQTGNINEQPSHITRAYVRAVASFGPMIEVRSAKNTQDLPVFVRMIDKDSRWDLTNGLETLITTLFQMNMNGYPLVLPDMIGGNGYNGRPDKELFIRWLQANTFMPSLQYSFAPWDYDAETVVICKKYTDLHAQYSETIRKAMELSVENGSPVNMPIWWIDPTDEEALPIADEYLLGETILVAPVVQANAVTRDIYLPKGKWIYADDENTQIDGGVWLRDFPAPLDTLPYFIKVA